MTETETALERVIAAAGSIARLHAILREEGVVITRQAIDKWTRVPHQHVHTVERVTGIPRHELRPDLYPKEREHMTSPMGD